VTGYLTLSKEWDMRHIADTSYPGKDWLYITHSGQLPCRAADVRDYRLILAPAGVFGLGIRGYARAI